jgi:hypothetical protein
MFQLKKWYLDCVTERGDVLINYSAALRYYRMPFQLVSCLSMADNQVEQSTTSTFRTHEPRDSGDGLRWRCRHTGTDGTWMSRSAPVRRELWNDSTGQVVWHCLQPSSIVSIQKSPIGPCEGLGYVELLDITVAPWTLGLRELRWGRFVSISESVVWIQWRGEHARTLVLRNGEEVLHAEVSGNRIQLDSQVYLEMADPVPLRSGEIADTVLSRIPLVRQILPSWLGNISEQKWRCSGQLWKDGLIAASGWVIHEVVQFSETPTPEGNGRR